MTMTQAALELKMVSDGIDRQYLLFHEATEGDNIDRHPALQLMLRDWVQPLAALIQQDRDNMVRPQLAQRAIRLLLGIDAMNIAFLSVRTVIRACIVAPTSSRALALDIGTVLHTELYLAQFEQEMGEDLFFMLSRELGRVASKSGKTKYDTFRRVAREKGLDYTSWGIGHRDVVGLYIMDKLRALGMITWNDRECYRGRMSTAYVTLVEEVEETIIQVERNIAITRPLYAPCIEPPLDWNGLTGGGWHTPEMRRSMPFCIKARPAAREALRRVPMPTLWVALNSLQKTAWRVNTRVLEAVSKVARLRNVKELVMNADVDKPPLPEFMAEGFDPRTPEEQEEKKAWKAAMTAWYTRNSLQRVAHSRMAAALRQAREYRSYPSIYFVWFADSRGRLYPQASGISPQGSDLQKGLIEFSEGRGLSGEYAVSWFLINGANMWGFDKAPLAERAVWHEDNREKILAIASDPIGNQDWLDADSPCMFLAWCFEYADWVHDPETFETRLPVPLDGSCSGLQHLSAMLRDEVGGASVNLVPSPEKQDLYRDVASVATKLMAGSYDGSEIARMWNTHPMTRTTVKRWVMTTPYGVTKSSGMKYVAQELEADPETGEVAYKMAAYAAPFVDSAIKQVVLKGMQIMAWLKAAGKDIAKRMDDDAVITWVTPSGFVATQGYYKHKDMTLRTKTYGHTRITVRFEQPDRDPVRHGQALAPNFVHSMDAAHLHLVAREMSRRFPGSSLAFIHDSFGTHADRTQGLYEILRDQFVRMYTENDPLGDFRREHGVEAPLPEAGTLNLDGVRDSEFVFS